jgi:hypothetical protein
MTSMDRSLSWLRPTRIAVVVPGKLDVLARAPHRRLKSVVLPVLGFPSSATEDAFISTGAGRERHDEDVASDRAGNADACRTHLDDARLAFLAKGQLAVVRQSERSKLVAGFRVELGLVEPGDGSDGEFAQ